MTAHIKQKIWFVTAPDGEVFTGHPGNTPEDAIRYYLMYAEGQHSYDTYRKWDEWRADGYEVKEFGLEPIEEKATPGEKTPPRKYQWGVSIMTVLGLYVITRAKGGSALSEDLIKFLDASGLVRSTKSIPSTLVHQRDKKGNLQSKKMASNWRKHEWWLSDNGIKYAKKHPQLHEVKAAWVAYTDGRQ